MLHADIVVPGLLAGVVAAGALLVGALGRERLRRARAERADAASRRRLQDILDSMFGFVGLCTPEGVLLQANRAPLVGAGLAPEAVLGKAFWDTPWWSYSPAVQAQLRAAVARAARGETVRYGTRVRMGDERFVDIDVQFAPLRNARGSIVQVLGFAIDVTETRRSEEALLAAEANLRGLLNSISEAVFLLDAEGYVLFANEAIARRLDTTVSGMMGRRIYDLVPDELAAYRRQMVEQVIATGKAVYHLLDRRGDRVLDNYLYPVRGADGKVARVAVFSADITERTSVELALRQSEQLLRELAGNIPEIFWVRDIGPVDAFLYLSPAWSALTGWPPPADLQGLFDVVHPEDYRRVVLEAAAAPHGGVDHEYRVVRADGGVRWLHVRTFPIRNAAGQAYRVAGVGEDISARKATEERLRRMAHYDALTDLPNRTLIRDTLARTLEQARHEGWLVAVLFIDIDRFKVVNDTLGHATGDALLQQVAVRLRECVRIRDVVGRLGGDEFVLVLPAQAQPDGCGAVARKVLHALAQPFHVEGREVFVTASIGITVFPNDTADVEALLRFADTAMYRAKEDGRNTHRFYTAEMNARAEEKLELENSLRRALERRELLLHYQPKFELASGALSGLEALLRWQRPGHGLVAPGEFIPLLEETGLIVPVGQWVIDEVCRQLAAWRDAGLAPAPVAVNISSRQFQVGDVAAVITRAAREHGVPTQLVACEITESAVMSYAARTIGILTELKAAGARISVDDFGTGYSSLSYLKRFPIDELKIDRVFVRDVAHDANDAAIVLATLDLAHRLGLKVVAEGVEDAAQAEFLRANDCDEVQGFLFARPLLAVEVERVLRERRARRPQDFFGAPPA